MRLVRRLAWLSLVLGFGHVVFGAIVRITGSGMGCGDHWPKCQGHWFPPLNRIDLIIEISHRYFAATLTAAILALLVTAWTRRGEAGVSGAGGVLRPAALAAVLVVTAAFFGAITVWLELANKLVIVTHLSLAMALLAVLVATIIRAGGPPQIPVYVQEPFALSSFHRRSNPGDAAWAVSPASARVTAVAAALGFATIVLGALTANIPGANTACTGFPLCRGGLLPSDPSQYLQFTHRLLAFGLFFLIGWMGVVFKQRGEPRLTTGARVLLSLVFTQLIIAATMIAYRLPPLWRSLHEGVGALLWIALFTLAYASHRVAYATAGNPEKRGVASGAAEARA